MASFVIEGWKLTFAEGIQIRPATTHTTLYVQGNGAGFEIDRAFRENPISKSTNLSFVGKDYRLTVSKNEDEGEGTNHQIVLDQVKPDAPFVPGEPWVPSYDHLPLLVLNEVPAKVFDMFLNIVEGRTVVGRAIAACLRDPSEDAIDALLDAKNQGGGTRKSTRRGGANRRTSRRRQ